MLYVSAPGDSRVPVPQETSREGDVRLAAVPKAASAARSALVDALSGGVLQARRASVGLIRVSRNDCARV